MAVSTAWIRHNMLGSPDYQGRKLTEIELRVQRSLQRLSIPDWYLNKRSEPPRILSNLTPIECRPPSWKNPGSRRNSNIGTTPKSTDTYVVNRSPRKSAKSKRNQKELLDTQIPTIKLRTNISKTFPKVSPSRKIQNINIVFPPGPPTNAADLSGEECKVEDSKYNTFVMRKHPPDQELRNDEQEYNGAEGNQSVSNPDNSRSNYSLRSLETTTTGDSSLRTRNLECNFPVHAASTPEHSPTKLLSSTLIEDSPRFTSLPCESVAERIMIEDDPPTETLSRSFLERTIPADTPRKTNLLFSQRFKDHEKSESPRMVSHASIFFGRKIEAIEPIVIHQEKVPCKESPKKSSISVSEIAKKFDPFGKPRNALPKARASSLETASPSTRFLYTKKKSVELENIVKTTRGSRGNSLVRGLISELTEKTLNKTSTIPRDRVELGTQNYVKNMVSALESGDTLKKSKEAVAKWRMSVSSEDTESYIESDGKSRISSTSMSVKDTDSGSDSEQMSPFLTAHGDTKFDYSTVLSRHSYMEDHSTEYLTDEEDSVYWIPVVQYKLPRTSSLLSVVSRLPESGQETPCISPIESGNESPEFVRSKAWSATFKKSSLPKKLFRIEETGMPDSGYSDRSNNPNSSLCSVVTDDTWSEEASNKSESEIKSPRFKWPSLRRQSIVGLKSTFV